MKQTIVISPHSDDGPISIGSLLYHNYLPCNILVPFNNSVENMLGIKENVTEIRKDEDKILEEKYGFKFVYGEFPDTSSRGVPWNNPNHALDKDMLEQVKEWIKKEIPQDVETIFYPMAYGSHPDHIICNEAIKQLNPLFKGTLIEYVEQPYYYENNSEGIAGLTEFAFSEIFKREMLSAYKSQITKERLHLLTNKIKVEYCLGGDKLCRV